MQIPLNVICDIKRDQPNLNRGSSPAFSKKPNQYERCPGQRADGTARGLNTVHDLE